MTEVAIAVDHRWDSPPKIRFAPDSPREGDGFEPSVPGKIIISYHYKTVFRRLRNAPYSPKAPGTGSSKPLPSSGEAANFRLLTSIIRLSSGINDSLRNFRGLFYTGIFATWWKASLTSPTAFNQKPAPRKRSGTGHDAGKRGMGRRSLRRERTTTLGRTPAVRSLPPEWPESAKRCLSRARHREQPEVVVIVT